MGTPRTIGNSLIYALRRDQGLEAYFCKHCFQEVFGDSMFSHKAYLVLAKIQLKYETWQQCCFVLNLGFIQMFIVGGLDLEYLG